jgi:hypothetical protein
MMHNRCLGLQWVAGPISNGGGGVRSRLGPRTMSDMRWIANVIFKALQWIVVLSRATAAQKGTLAPS